MTGIDVELQFTPTRTATPAMHELVERAFAEAEVIVARWTVPWGEDLHDPADSGMRWADPHLHVRLVSGPGSGITRTGALTAAHLPKLGRALASIRQTLPELPLGIEERTDGRLRRLGFGREADSATITRSLACVSDEGLGEHEAWMWSEGFGRWCEVIVARRKSLHDPLLVELRPPGSLN